MTTDRYKFSTRKIQVQNMLCTNIVNVKTKTKQKFCTQHVVNLYFSWNSMNNISSYCGLTDLRMRASEKDLPVSSKLKIGKRFTKYILTILAHSLKTAHVK